MVYNPQKTIHLPYGDQEITLRLSVRNLLDVISPYPAATCADPLAELRRALFHPIGAPSLERAARHANRVVIVADDLTRQTPVGAMLPLLLEELNKAGVSDGQIQVVIALGTHRPMTQDEIQARFGRAALDRVPVLNNPWQDPSQMVNLGLTSNGTPVQINKIVMEADFVIGLGSIVPHHIPGFSGGAKIIQPGVCGVAATGATHYLSTRALHSYLGSLENPVRTEMETIAERAGLKAIFNTVLDPEGRLTGAFYGAPRPAHRAGVALAQKVFGAPVSQEAEIVIASSHPCDLEFWQAHKALYPASLAQRQGGTIILITPCPEGVSVMHQDMLNFTALDAKQIEAAIQDGTIEDVVSGALALAWAKIRQRAAVSLVSGGIPEAQTRALGFTHFASLEDALEAAFARHGDNARVSVLPHAPETLPLLAS
jgi:nickel-dependent lactate racemase